MAYELAGELYKVFETENKTDTFQAREFVVKTDGSYTQFIKFQLTQDRCSIIDSFQTGQKVRVSFDLRGREWNDKYFTNLHAWKIEKDAVNEPEEGPAFDETQYNRIESTDDSSESMDDLPF